MSPHNRTSSPSSNSRSAARAPPVCCPDSSPFSSRSPTIDHTSGVFSNSAASAPDEVEAVRGEEDLRPILDRCGGHRREATKERRVPVRLRLVDGADTALRRAVDGGDAESLAEAFACIGKRVDGMRIALDEMGLAAHSHAKALHAP